MLLSDLIREHILSTLEDHDGNRTMTAHALGLSARTLRNYLSSYRKSGYEIPEKVWQRSTTKNKDTTIKHSPIVVDTKEDDLTEEDPIYNYFASNEERLYYLDTGNKLQ